MNKSIQIDLNGEIISLPKELSDKIILEAKRLNVPLEVYLKIFVTEILFDKKVLNGNADADSEKE